MALTDTDRLQMITMALMRYNNLGNDYKYYLDEGSSFPTAERGITELYRSYGYELKSIPIVTGAEEDSCPGNVACRFNETYLSYESGLVEGAHYSYINVPTSPHVSRTRTYAGNNNILFSTSAKINQWLSLTLHYGHRTTSQKISNFVLLFDDSSTQNIESAITNGYLSPLCMVGSYDIYGFEQWRGITDGTETETASYPITELYIKPLKYGIAGVNFDTAKDSYWVAPDLYDGFFAKQFEPKIQFSLSPMYNFDDINIKFIET